MNKTKLFLKIVKFKERHKRGKYWISFIQGFFNPQGLFILWTMIAAWIELYLLRGFKWRDVLIFIGLVIAGFLMEFVKWYFGDFDYKKGLWKKEKEWLQEDEVIAPFNVKVKKQLKAIAKKLEIKDYFDDDWENK